MTAALSLEQSALVLAWIAIVLLAFAMSALMRQLHAVTEALQAKRVSAGPANGTVLPPIPGLTGRPRALVLFSDADCTACERAAQFLDEQRRNGATEAEAVVVFRGEALPGLTLPTLADAKGIFEQLGVTVTPTVVAIDDRRRVIASALVGSTELFGQFLDYVEREKERT